MLAFIGARTTNHCRHFFNVVEHAASGDNGIILEDYTGLKDKNGKEIYEGDLHRDSDENNTLLQCMWNPMLARFEWVEIEDGETVCGSENEMNEDEEAEVTNVIGNIHENPELLTQN